MFQAFVWRTDSTDPFNPPPPPLHIFLSALIPNYLNKKFWEELISYFSLIILLLHVYSLPP
jgi:hypothetical protein